MTDYPTLFGDQDDCLIDITDGKPPRSRSLRALPPWRAVMIARVALKARLMTQDEVDALVEAAGGTMHLIKQEKSSTVIDRSKAMKIRPEIHRVEIPLEELIDKDYLEDDPEAATAYLQSLGFDTTREITWVDDVARPIRILTQKKND